MGYAAITKILTNKWFWIVLITIIIIIIVVYKYKHKYVAAKDVQLPSDTQAGGITTWNAGQYTDAIYNDLNDVASLHDSKPYTDALSLSNSQVVAIYNDWNDRYKSKFNNKDLISAIEGDFTIWNYSWATAAGNLVERLKSLIPNRS